MPERFTEPEDEKLQAQTNVAFADISHVAKLSLKGNDVRKTIREEICSSQPVRPSDVLTPTSGALKETLCCIIAHDEALIVSSPATQDNAATYLRNLAGTACFHITDITSSLAGLYLIGPRSRDVILKLTELNVNPERFPNLAVAQAPFFHVQAALLHLDLDGLPGYQLYFDRGFGEYLWDRVIEAGREYRIGPIGASTLKLLGWKWN